MSKGTLPRYCTSIHCTLFLSNMAESRAPRTLMSQTISHTWAVIAGRLFVRVLYDGMDPETSQGGGAAEGRELQPDGQRQRERIDHVT